MDGLSQYEIFRRGIGGPERVNTQAFMRNKAVEYVLSRPDLLRQVLDSIDEAPKDAVRLRTGMTPKQKELLDFIKSYSGRNGYCPSYDDMMKALGLRSKSGIHRMVYALKERGYVRLLPNRARSIELTRAAP